MHATNILLLIVVGCISVWALYTGIRNHQRLRLNQKIGKELDFLIESTMKIVRQDKATLTKSVKKPKSINLETSQSIDLTSSEMLSSILTVIVNKYGNLRLSMGDFSNIKNEDYISVYVDTQTNELILSLDHYMGSSDPLNLINFSKPDDTTFH